MTRRWVIALIGHSRVRCLNRIHRLSTMRNSAGWPLRLALRLEYQRTGSACMPSTSKSAKSAAETLGAAGLADPARRFRLFVKAVQDYAIFILDEIGRAHV